MKYKFFWVGVLLILITTGLGIAYATVSPLFEGSAITAFIFTLFYWVFYGVSNINV